MEVMKNAKNYNSFLLNIIVGNVLDAYNVIDFGAGSGTFSIEVMRCLPSLKLTCVEPDSELRHHLRTAGLKAVDSLERITINSNNYAYSLNVLEHIENDLGALKSLYSVLEPGGMLFLYVPAFAILWSSMDTQVGHLRRYRISDLRDKCECAGFKIEYAKYSDSIGYFASLWLRMFGGKSGKLNPSSVKFYDRFLFPLSRILDRVVDNWFGKNIILYARKPL